MIVSAHKKGEGLNNYSRNVSVTKLLKIHHLQKQQLHLIFVESETDFKEVRSYQVSYSVYLYYHKRYLVKCKDQVERQGKDIRQVRNQLQEQHTN